MTETGISLVVQREVAASIDRTYRAWTEPEMMTRWWGPPGTECIAVELDVRVGGSYRIGNAIPSGDVIWITGTYLEVEPPRRLVFTWGIEGADEESRVTVKLSSTEAGAATRVVVVHERIGNEEIAADHEAGWNGCLDSLVDFFDTPFE